MELRPDEQVIRTDLVNTNFSVVAAPRLAVMILTNQRVVLSPPNVSSRYRLFAWTAGLFIGPLMPGGGGPPWNMYDRFRPPIGKSVSIELNTIVKIWSWRPRLSAPPSLQTSNDGGHDFQLCERDTPWQRRASLEAIEAHLADVERAHAMVLLEG